MHGLWKSLSHRGRTLLAYRLLQHGKTNHDGRGAVVKTVNKQTRRRLQEVLSRTDYANAERYFDVYAVVTPDKAVVTAAHRTRRTHLH